MAFCPYCRKAKSRKQRKQRMKRIAKELKTYADEISELDAKMLKLRDKIEKM